MKIRKMIAGVLLALALAEAVSAGESCSFAESLPAETVVLPPDMAGQLALLRETVALVEMLQAVVEASGMYVAPDASIRMMVDKWLLPRCRELQRLSASELSGLCLLADGIDWQSTWLLDMAEGDSCVALPRAEAEPLTCLERLQKAAQVVEHRLSAPGEEAVKVELRRFLSTLGGQQVLLQPARLLQQRMARDYKTVYSFFCEFKAALEQEDVPAMRELAVYTDYLLQSEADELRINALAAVYARVCRAEYEVRPLTCRITPTMQDALLPFLRRLPALRGVLP